MPKLKQQKFVVYRPDKGKYLVWGMDIIDNKPWNSKMSWTTRAIYAKRFDTKESAKWAMLAYHSYTSVEISYVTKEIWE